MNPTDSDKQYMRQAIDEARKAFEAGDYPVASVLVIDGDVVDILSNRLIAHNNWGSHAESLVLQKHSSIIREKTKRLSKAVELPGEVVLYTTLEPCMMCLGTALIHKVKRIVYGCPDPRGGVTSLIKPEQLTDFYQKRWPEIVGGVLWEDSYKLITTYHANQSEDFWPAISQAFKDKYSAYKEMYG